MPSFALIWIFLLTIQFGSPIYYSGSNFDVKALEAFRNIKRRTYYKLRRYVCNRWNGRCVPWSSEPQHKCCDGLACKCNLWGQNCKCTSRLWG